MREELGVSLPRLLFGSASLPPITSTATLDVIKTSRWAKVKVTILRFMKWMSLILWDNNPSHNVQ